MLIVKDVKDVKNVKIIVQFPSNLNCNEGITELKGEIMTFKVKRMTKEDHAKIFTNETKTLLRKYCIPQDEWDEKKDKRIAFDGERDAIFVSIEKYAPIDGPNNYLLLLGNIPVVIQLGGPSDETVFPFDLADNLKPNYKQVKQLIYDAFVVYGRNGIGDPQSLSRSVTPIFTE